MTDASSQSERMPDRLVEQLDARTRAEYAEELAYLLKHVAQMTGSPKKSYRETPLGRGEATWIEEKKHRRLVLASSTLLDAFRNKSNEPVAEALLEILVALLRRRTPFAENDIGALLQPLLADPSRVALLTGVLNAVERTVGARPLAANHQQKLLAIHAALSQGDSKKKAAAQKLAVRLDALRDSSITARLHADDGWADHVRRWFTSLEPPVRDQWNALLLTALDVLPESAAKNWKVQVQETGISALAQPDAAFQALRRMQLARVPESTWKERMAEHLLSVGRQRAADIVRGCLHNVTRSKPGTLVRQSLNRELFRGLLWLSAELADAETVQAVQHATRFFYKNNSPLAETGITVLYQMGTKASAAALATIYQGVKADSQRSLIRSAHTLLAEKLGLSPDELEDGGVPLFGFTEFGRLTRTFDQVQAELRISCSRNPELLWSRAGKAFKSPPAAVKREHSDEVESLKTTAKGVREALGSLAARLESSWLAGRKMRLEAWREQLIDHFVAGTIGRRLIWQFDAAGQISVGRWRDDAITDHTGRPLPFPADAIVTLWHPLHANPSQVLAWRDRLEAENLTQPFKQAHREIYLVTDAERTTNTYSNRFAAHIIRQAQFRQLAKSRGWKASLVGPWDGGDRQTAERRLPYWGFWAEYWVSGAGDEYQTGFTYLATDQVRFYRNEAAGPVPLETVPPLVFSEVMRDVDLFVGVASVGNDPNWSDGGPDGRYRDYWQGYSFGDLSATAQTRKAVLERLLPRLQIADRCAVADKFLHVRGDLRNYKIHLGSGNILTSPNDQYLCIVAKQSVNAGKEQVFLPFEGDNMLSIILSKALLLAEDVKITDPTIVSQIKRR